MAVEDWKRRYSLRFAVSSQTIIHTEGQYLLKFIGKLLVGMIVEN